MRKLFYISIFFLMATSATYAQNPLARYYLEQIIIENDTLPHLTLSQVDVYARGKVKRPPGDQQFWRMVSRVKKVYPYAKEAARLYEKYQQEIPESSKRSVRKAYIRKAEDELMALYGPQIKKMTISEGRILIKLIDRESHITSYDLIDDVKGGVPAVFWQGVARIFGNNLKSKYDPNGEDWQIEQIIRYLEAGLI